MWVNALPKRLAWNGLLQYPVASIPGNAVSLGVPASDKPGRLADYFAPVIIFAPELLTCKYVHIDMWTSLSIITTVSCLP